jgi:hypothetical protein
MIVVIGLASVAAPAKANTIDSFSLTDCGPGGTGTLCPAATYSFNIGATSATLTIHIDGAPVAGSTNIVSVDLGFTNNSNLTLTGAPVVFTDNGVTVSSLYDNTFENNINSSSNCTANGTAAFICASSSSGGATIQQGDTLTWTWNYTLGAGIIDAAGDVHVGANYDPAKGRIVSTTANIATPEPNTITLLLGGLLGVGLFARRRLLHS